MSTIFKKEKLFDQIWKPSQFGMPDYYPCDHCIDLTCVWRCQGLQIVDQKPLHKPLRSKNQVFKVGEEDDFFDPKGDSSRNICWEIIRKSPSNTFFIITDWPERINRGLPEDWSEQNYPNVMIGVVVSSNDDRYKINLLGMVQCANRFILINKLPTRIDLDCFYAITECIDKVIIDLGPENTGLKKRELFWYTYLLDQLSQIKIQVFYHLHETWGEIDIPKKTTILI